MGKILAIVSHPDDETIGCGGTLALHANESNVLCLTCNPRNRKNELESACAALGIGNPIVFEEDCVVSSNGLVKRVADVIAVNRPNIVITHLPFDYHSDHRATYEVVKEAIEWVAHTTIYSKPCLIERLLLMEINTLIPNPHILVDITDTLAKKRRALQSYVCQLAKFPWGYYQRFNDKKAELRGAQANCIYAEAFFEESLAKNSPFYEKNSIKNLLR
jgi:N-acetylglucosamine malate deacetylase 1